jgi:hypothetical protein
MTHTKCNCFIPYNGGQEKDEEKKENLIYGMTAIEWIMLISILMNLDDIKKKREGDKNEQRD